MSDDIYINIDDEQPKPVDIVQVEFDKQDVYIDVQQDYAPVIAVNGKVGYVTIDKSDVGLSNVENVSITGTSGVLQTQINNINSSGFITGIPNIVYTTGNQTVAGLKNFTTRLQVNGSGVLLSGEIPNLPNTIVYITGNQTISGIKTFTTRPTVNGTGLLLSGEIPTLPLTIVYTTGDQTISGHKSFRYKVNGGAFDIDSEYNDQSKGWIYIDKDGNSLGYGTNSITLDYLGVAVYGNTSFTSRPTVNGTGVLLSGEASAITLPTTIVYTTGNQTISGVKTFASRPTVNGTGVLLSGEAASLPGTIVYTTGDQTVSGVKTFASRPTVNGTGVLLSGEAASLPTTIVYTTGNQTISGNKDFYGDEIVFSGLNVIFADNTGISYGEWQFSNRPTVNGTGVLLSGEISQLTETIVYTNNDQTITGLKTFISGISIGGPSQLSTPTIKIFDAANGGYSTFYWEDAQLYINDVTNRSLYYDFSKYSTGTMQRIAVVKDLETTGSTLNTKINSLSGYVTGVTGTFGASVRALNTYAVLTTGNQTISGIKTFATGVDILSIGTGLRIIYGTGTNSGEFGILDWSNGQFRINTLGVGSGTTRTVAVGTASSFGIGGVGTYINTLSNQVSLNASQNSVRVSSSNVEIYARNAGGTATSLHLSAGGDLVRINKLIASSGADIYFSGTAGTGASGSSVGVLVSGLWNNTGQTYTGIRYNVTLDSGASGLVPNTTNSLLNLAVNNTGVFNVNSKGQVLIQQLAGATVYDNAFEVKRGSTSYFSIRDDGSAVFPASNLWIGNLTNGSVGFFSNSQPNAIVSKNGFFGISNTNDAVNYPSEHTVRLYRGADFVLDLRNDTYPTSGHQFRVFNATGTNSGEFGVFGWQATGTGSAPNALVIGAQASQSGSLRDIIITGANLRLNPVSGSIIANNGIINNSTAILDLSQTWSGASVFTGFNLNITRGSNATNTSANTRLMHVQMDGNTHFAVRPAYDVDAGNISDWQHSAQTVRITNNTGTVGFTVRSSQNVVGLPTASAFAWGTSIANLQYDLALYRDAAGILAQRNGLSTQQFRVYNYTGTNSGEFATFGWQATGTSAAPNALVIGAQASQSGILRDVILTGRNINISSSGVIIPNPTVPTSTGSAGARGQISWDNDFIYVCVSGNSWKRAALTTW